MYLVNLHPDLVPRVSSTVARVGLSLWKFINQSTPCLSQNVICGTIASVVLTIENDWHALTAVCEQLLPDTPLERPSTCLVDICRYYHRQHRSSGTATDKWLRRFNNIAIYRTTWSVACAENVLSSDYTVNNNYQRRTMVLGRLLASCQQVLMFAALTTMFANSVSAQIG